MNNWQNNADPNHLFDDWNMVSNIITMVSQKFCNILLCASLLSIYQAVQDLEDTYFGQ